MKKIHYLMFGGVMMLALAACSPATPEAEVMVDEPAVVEDGTAMEETVVEDNGEMMEEVVVEDEVMEEE